jgi:hypothetical protein
MAGAGNEEEMVAVRDRDNGIFGRSLWCAVDFSMRSLPMLPRQPARTA